MSDWFDSYMKQLRVNGELRGALAFIEGYSRTVVAHQQTQAEWVAHMNEFNKRAGAVLEATASVPDEEDAAA